MMLKIIHGIHLLIFKKLVMDKQKLILNIIV